MRCLQCEFEVTQHESHGVPFVQHGIDEHQGTVAPVALILRDGIKQCFPRCQARGGCVFLNNFSIAPTSEIETRAQN